jgi:serine/threonine protein kinase
MDLYAVGCIFYMLLTCGTPVIQDGRHTFPATKIIDENPLDAALLRKLVATDPEARGTAGTLLREFASLLEPDCITLSTIEGEFRQLRIGVKHAVVAADKINAIASRVTVPPTLSDTSMDTLFARPGDGAASGFADRVSDTGGLIDLPPFSEWGCELADVVESLHALHVTEKSAVSDVQDEDSTVKNMNPAYSHSKTTAPPVVVSGASSIAMPNPFQRFWTRLHMAGDKKVDSGPKEE